MTAAATVASQAHAAGYCTHPVRLRGHVDTVDAATGELRRTLDTAAHPEGVLLVACRNRRTTVCPACAKVYRGDAWQLIAAGLRGGKGIPAEVDRHPRVFVTLTAPSFGAVHSRREVAGCVRRCRPRRTGGCQHGRPRGCRVRHDPGDPALGQPLCPDCFDYPAAVLWNSYAGALWNRTVIAVRRHLARTLGVTAGQLAAVARVSFVKVVEYQARGVVHLHAIVRVDGPDGAGTPPPQRLGGDALVEAIRAAAATATVPFALPDGTAAAAAWGVQLDVRPLPAGDVDRTGMVAAYVAKYATKSTDALGALDHRIRTPGEIARLPVNPHLRRLVATCWHLGGDPRYRALRLRAWAHSLGYRGHWTTKSRRYSTTFTALRTARVRHAADGPDSEFGEGLRLGEWRYAGRGYRWMSGTTFDGS